MEPASRRGAAPRAPGAFPEPASDPGTVHDPGTGTVPDPVDPVGPVFGPGRVSAVPARGHFAPTLAGGTEPGASVVVRLREVGDGQAQDYAPPVEEDGAWALDLRENELPAGRYAYSVWAVLDGVSSRATEGSFELVGVGVEGLAHPEPLPISEAATTGVVVGFTGPEHGTLVVVAALGAEYQMAFVPLDAAGRSTQRLRLFNAGSYQLMFTAYDGEFAGPHQTWFLPVIAAPGAGNYGPQPYGADGELISLTEL